MRLDLTPEQAAANAAFSAFVKEDVAPFAERWDAEERIPAATIQALANRGYLGAALPRQYGGLDLDPLVYGMLHEEVGRGCSSLRSLLTVQGMVAHAIARWGTDAQRTHWLPRMASGEVIGAFALTEPRIGCDAKHVETRAAARDGGYRIAGTKKS
jgi:glutaryl-CoA dehydrogenase (non-decarboxylating)